MVKVMPTHWNGRLAMKIQARPRSPRPTPAAAQNILAGPGMLKTIRGRVTQDPGPLPDDETQGLVVLVMCSHIIRRCGSVTGARSVSMSRLPGWAVVACDTASPGVVRLERAFRDERSHDGMSSGLETQVCDSRR